MLGDVRMCRKSEEVSGPGLPIWKCGHNPKTSFFNFYSISSSSTLFLQFWVKSTDKIRHRFLLQACQYVNDVLRYQVGGRRYKQIENTKWGEQGLTQQWWTIQYITVSLSQQGPYNTPKAGLRITQVYLDYNANQFEDNVYSTTNFTLRCVS